MGVGLFLYDLIPTGITVSKAQTYEQEEETTKVLSDSKEAQTLRNEKTTSKNSTSGSSTTVKTNIVLKEYDVSKTDLARYTQSGSYQKGRPDPFAEVKTETATTGEGDNSTTSTAGTSGSTEKSSQVSDGTFYNSTKVK